jgi:hypothetical protein
VCRFEFSFLLRNCRAFVTLHFRPACLFSPGLNVSFDSLTFYRNATFSFTFGSSAAAGSYFFECVGWVLSSQFLAAPFSAMLQMFQNSSLFESIFRAAVVSSQSVTLSSAFSSSNSDIKVRPTNVVTDKSFILRVTGKFPRTSSSVSTLSASCGSQHLCIATDYGSVYCRGRGDNQQLGQDAFESSNIFQLAPNSNPESNISVLLVGGSHSCVLKSDSRLRCWGSNLNGQLGISDLSTSSGVKVPVPLQASKKPLFAALGLSHSCVLFQSGAVWCWGDNSRGQHCLAGCTSERSG